jgi:hypothetical protein
MFDGYLPLYENEPEGRAEPTVRTWSWGLVALVLGTTTLSIAAGVLFPDVLASPTAYF